MKYSIIQGGNGIREDQLAFLKPWGFSISGIITPTQFRAGTSDSDVPLEHSIWMTRKNGHSELRVLEGKNHLTIMEPEFIGGFRWLRGLLASQTF